MVESDWLKSYLDYLCHDALLIDSTKSRRIADYAKSFVVVGHELYKVEPFWNPLEVCPASRG